MEIIDDGLRRNVAVVAFPAKTYILANFVGMLHPIVYDTIGRLATKPAGNISRRFFNKRSEKKD